MPAKNAPLLDPLSGVQSGRPGTISFVLGLPDPATFPLAELEEAARQTLTRSGDIALQYGPEQGYGRLIDFLVDKWGTDEGVTITRANLTITSGSTDAVNLLSRTLGRPGSVVLVEAPSYRDTLHLFNDHGFRLVQVPVDEQGLRTDALRQTLVGLQREGLKPDFLYTIPSYQNPSGATLSPARRQALLALAREYEFPIVADDVYRDLCFEADLPAALGALDPTGEHVITVGSFSKIMAAGLRLGWVIASPALIDRMVSSGLRAMGGGANPFVSHIVTHFCEQGRLQPHIARLRDVYHQRRDAMLLALETHMPNFISWSRPTGGYFIWLNLPPTLSADKVVHAADEAGVSCLSGTGFYAQAGGDDHLRLAFSYVPTVQIEEGIATLARVMIRQYPA